MKDNEKKNKSIHNSLLNVAEKISNLAYQSHLFKAPIQDIERADYNLREYLYTLRWKQLTYRYSTDGIFKTMIRQPVLDALRNGIKIKSSYFNQYDIDKFNYAINEKNLLNSLKELFIYNRLYGGAGLIIEIENDDITEPLSYKDINKGDNINYYAVSRWELNNTIEQKGYLLASDIDNIFFNGQRINRDRIVLLKGDDAPFFVRNILGGWGLSVAEPLIAPSNIYEKSINLVYQLLDQAKIDIYNIEGLKDTLAQGNDNQIIDHLQLTNILKNFQNALVLDKNDAYNQRQLNMMGIVDIIKELKLDICSAVKIPAVILWGMSPAGFSNGEFDLKQYYANIESELRSSLKYIILKILKIECMSIFGDIPKDLDFEYYPLLIQTEEQQEKNQEKEFLRLKELYQLNLITKKELFTALNNRNLFTDRVKSDDSEEYLMDTQLQLETMSKQEEQKPTDIQQDKPTIKEQPIFSDINKASEPEKI